MKVLALSLVTNKAVLDAGPRGDDLSTRMYSSQLFDSQARGRLSSKTAVSEAILPSSIHYSEHYLRKAVLTPKSA